MTLLCYHDVSPSSPSDISVTPEAFDRQVEWLSRNRTVVPLDRAVEMLDPSGRLPRGHAAITFDDGFVGVHAHALPALRRHALPAAVFVVAGTLADPPRPVDWVIDAGDHPLRTLSADQIHELSAAGVTIGSHSFAHHDLTRLDDDACESDLRTSREMREDLLGRPVPYLAYPAARHDARVR